MKRIVKQIGIAIIFTASFFCFSCSRTDTQPRDKDLVLVMAEVNPEDSITGQFDAAFKSKVEELSNGKIKIDLHYSGILGDESQVMKLIVSPDSSIHLARVSASLASYGGKKSKLITIPYTFSSKDHFWKFAESDIAREILDEPYESGLGVKGICYGEEGFRNFFAISPLNSIDDMKGMNIRVSNSKTMQDLVHSLSANPVTVKFTDLFAKMQTGETNAAEQPIANYYSNEFHHVAPYMIMDGHNLGAVQILINSSVWDSLSETQKAIIDDAGKYASSQCRQITLIAEKSVVESLNSEGAKIVEVTDKTPWQNACKEMISDSSKEYPELYKKILELNK